MNEQARFTCNFGKRISFFKFFEKNNFNIFSEGAIIAFFTLIFRILAVSPH
jgi:hypothetical protein